MCLVSLWCDGEVGENLSEAEWEINYWAQLCPLQWHQEATSALVCFSVETSPAKKKLALARNGACHVE
jgi:hypothetical protein